MGILLAALPSLIIDRLQGKKLMQIDRCALERVDLRQTASRAARDNGGSGNPRPGAPVEKDRT